MHLYKCKTYYYYSRVVHFPCSKQRQKTYETFIRHICFCRMWPSFQDKVTKKKLLKAHEEFFYKY